MEAPVHGGPSLQVSSGAGAGGRAGSSPCRPWAVQRQRRPGPGSGLASAWQAGPEAQVAGAVPETCPPPVSQSPPEEGLVELPGSFSELLAFFCTHATIHGAIRLVCSSRNRLKTASWGLLFLGALGVLYCQFALLFAQYWRHPAIMTVSVHSERKLFPAVTLCDMNPQRPRPLRRHLEALDAFARENLHSLYKFNLSEEGQPGVTAPSAEDPGPAFQLDRAVRLQRLSPPGRPTRVGFQLCNGTGGDCFHRAYSLGAAAVREWYRFHYLDVLALLPTAHEDAPQSHGDHFVFSCHYDGQACQAENFQTFHHPTHGSCYTFSGFWSAPRAGVTHGISLILRTEQRGHLPLLSTKAGIKAMVHERSHAPFLEHRGFSVRPGTETTIGIREDEVHRRGRPYGNCTDGVEGVDVPLLYNASYTSQACLVSCFQQLMLQTCSCGYYLLPLPPGGQHCSSARNPAWGHCFYRLYRDLETHRLPCFSRCPRPCRETSYKLSAGTSRWPSPKSADWILAVLGGREPRNQSQSAQPRSNIAKVNIFYQELNYRTVNETPLYSVPQLLSAMGSLWSLWFGSSVLSVLELLELLLDATALALLLGYRRLCRGRASQPRAMPSPRPAGCPPGTDTRSAVPAAGQGSSPTALARVSAEE
ncbi:amiloride-sensitive sodium channel subunit delta isoform X2 [Dasypus novemcinctus]|uniref:amiloride-sensitive sodium channel subunit delta isoform X2 n=1 Tax=Dasypus novemcinctus TaxID=9361 RepID=UPI0039C9023D